MDRIKLTRMIHIAKDSARLCPECGKVLFRPECPDCGKKTLQLDDGRYRHILENFGASSCRFMAEPELEKVYSFFLQAGFRPREDPGRHHEASKRRTIGILISEAKDLFGEDLWEKRLVGFVGKTMGRKSLWACNDKELRKALGWIRRYRKYLAKREEEKGNEEGN